MADNIADKTEKMFGPLTFQETSQQLGNLTDIETKCLMCEDSFNLAIRLDIFLRHLLDVHSCVIEEVQNIAKLPEYLKYWRDRLKAHSVESIIPSVKIDSTDNKYYIFSTLLKEDKEIRHKLRLEYVLEVQEFERTDKGFLKQCLFCRKTIEGTRLSFVEHLSSSHNLKLGDPQNLVFLEDMINFIEQKLESLECIYCEKTFPDRNILKEHMRKKLHKRINPKNRSYDIYYIANYAELGKTWKKLKKETDNYALELGEIENSDTDYLDWTGADDLIRCLFCSCTEVNINELCLHMINVHNFNWAQSTESFDFYQKVKLVNYIRRQIHLKKCPHCGTSFDNSEDLETHLALKDHYKVPKDVKEFEQPEFFFPTYENDAFLYQIEDVENVDNKGNSSNSI